MICPHCGADIENGSSSCPLCGEEINKEKEYKKFVLKGDGALEGGRPEAAIGFYEKALQITGGSEESYIKLGNAYNKKRDRKAAGIYFKALKCNFYNEHVHNLLISIYDKYNRLPDLKAWYEESGKSSDPEFTEKFINIIDNIGRFKKEGGAPESEKKSSEGLMSYIKKYGMMNAALIVFAVIMAGALIAGVVFKTDPSVMLLFGMGFFIASIFIISYINIKKVKKKKKDKENKESFDDLLPPEGK